jgi:hypothetical protein
MSLVGTVREVACALVSVFAIRAVEVPVYLRNSCSRFVRFTVSVMWM